MNAYRVTHPKYPELVLRLLTYFQESMDQWKLVVQVWGIPEDPIYSAWSDALGVLNYMAISQRDGWEFVPDPLETK